MEDYNLTTVVHVCHLLMLLTVNFLCYPTVLLTLSTDYPVLCSLLYGINSVSQSFFSVYVTGTYTPGQSGACLRSQPSGERRENTEEAISI